MTLNFPQTSTMSDFTGNMTFPNTPHTARLPPVEKGGMSAKSPVMRPKSLRSTAYSAGFNEVGTHEHSVVKPPVIQIDKNCLNCSAQKNVICIHF